MGFWEFLARAEGLRKLVPEAVRDRLRGHFVSRDAYVKALWDRDAPDVEEASTYPARHPVTLGIIREFRHGHRHYVEACRELGVPYRLVDISGPDWIETVRSAGCDAFLVRPATVVSVWKQMFDDRLRVMSHEMNLLLYPSFDEVWIYESKRRMHYWLEAHDVPHPRTWVFYDRAEAREFAETAALPIVYKSDFGAAASGVRIFHDRSRLRRWIDRCFKKGVARRESHRLDREWGSVLLQEYLRDIDEWRVVRIGDSYFGHLKLKKGDFHSGSGIAGWEDPPRALLDLTRRVTDAGGFRSMALDVFATGDGRWLVNELQTLFGFKASRKSQMIVDGKPGRYLYDAPADTWRFEEGDFSAEGCYKLRVETLVDLLMRHLERPSRDAGDT